MKPQMRWLDLISISPQAVLQPTASKSPGVEKGGDFFKNADSWVLKVLGVGVGRTLESAFLTCATF